METQFDLAESNLFLTVKLNFRDSGARLNVPIELRPPPPLELSGHRNNFNFFCLKIAENGFRQKKILYKIFKLKEPHFWPNIATNLSKNYDFATRQHDLTGA